MWTSGRRFTFVGNSRLCEPDAACDQPASPTVRTRGEEARMNAPFPDEDAPSDELTYYPNARDVPSVLVRDPTRFSVRFGLVREPLRDAADELLRRRAVQVVRLPEHQIAVYTVSPAEAKEAVQLLNRERSVDIAAPVLHRSARSTDDIYVTDRFVVQFLPDVSREQIDQLNAKHGVTILDELGYAENGFVLGTSPGTDGLGGIHMANTYRATGLTRFSHPDLILPKHKRTGSGSRSSAAPTAGSSALLARDVGYVSRQWHLVAADVVDAWSLTMGEPDVTIAILDDGVDTTHPEFDGKVRAQFDFAANQPDASPKSRFNNHGTACSGVAVARGLKASGAAPGCGLMAVRLPDHLGSTTEGRMFQWAADNGADVISCSWGPEDGTGTAEPLPGSTEAALAYCAAKGRGGKGIPICWAAGNGNESVDLDGYAASRHVIAVAASTDRERRAWYSDQGEAIWICAPSSGAVSFGEKSILTTDRTGPEGYNDGGEGIDSYYTNTFGGTSSAAPLVAGVVGLMLSVNPDLTARQVRDILKDTATKIGAGYDESGHSPEYGFGQVNALAAVLAARDGLGDTAHRTPSIAGPSAVGRSDPSPVFALRGAHPRVYWAVEVATMSRLFDRAIHEPERSADNFYASWQDSDFFDGSEYRLPDEVWLRLRRADRLYYRAWFSASHRSWQDPTTTVRDSAHSAAPSITVGQADRIARDLAEVGRRGPRTRFHLPVGRPARVLDPDERLWRQL